MKARLLDVLVGLATSFALSTFAQRVDLDAAARAKAAGSTEVMPRSVFTQNLARILGVAQDSEE